MTAPRTDAGRGAGRNATPRAVWHDEVALPALLRAARTAYGSAIRAALCDVECDDVPRNGAFVLGAISRTGSSLSQVITDLGVSKQAAGQVVDTLVVRGYLDRSSDPDDRRRMTVALTERGRVAASAARAAVEIVDAAVIARVGADCVAHTRATLASLVEVGRDLAPSSTHGRP